MLDNHYVPDGYGLIPNFVIFGQKISTSSKVSNNQAKQLHQTMSRLEQNYHDIDYYLGTLISSLNSPADENVNLSTRLFKLIILIS